MRIWLKRLGMGLGFLLILAVVLALFASTLGSANASGWWM